ncbi:hypothetical protein [Marinomonas transparens]|uniref:Uncharacterized protein n=1 Tax=Marinomonas transparens TaxID=2795388 RepID=A0A934JMS9_9GAMM|nr:hypothetical protein [Marinomonas transparens]MBJ7537298.1 hypothetical protein [Marinomonas transparens]
MGITNQQPEKARGFLIVAFAILIFVTMPIMAMTYFTIPEAIIKIYPKASVGLLYFLGVLNVFSMVFTSLVWAWKKIGVYGFFVVLAVSLLINLYIGVAASEFLVSLTGGAILLFIVQNRWEQFE